MLLRDTMRLAGSLAVSRSEVGCYQLGPVLYKTDVNLSVIGFVTLLHGLTPRLGVYVMNVSLIWLRNESPLMSAVHRA